MRELSAVQSYPGIPGIPNGWDGPLKTDGPSQLPAAPEGPLVIPAEPPLSPAARDQFLKFDEDQLRADIAKSLVLSIGQHSGVPELQYPSTFLAHLDRAISLGNAGLEISQALRADIERGDSNLTGALTTATEKVAETLGSEAASAIIQQLLITRPPAATVAFILGPKLVDSVINDVPQALREIADVTGFHWDGTRYKVDWKPYNPTEAGRARAKWVQWQQEQSRPVGATLRAIWLDVREALTAEVQRVRRQMRGE